jgi:predicted ester cyclase
MSRVAVLLSAIVLMVLGPMMGISQPRVVAQEATPATTAAADCPTTTEAENKDLATRYTEDHQTDPDVNATLLANEVKRHRVRGDQIYTAEEATEVDRAFGAAFPDLQVTVDAVVAEGDLVAVAWTAEGTQQGEFYGVPATGRTAQWEGQNLMRFACGKIVELWVSADALGLHEQLGAITEDERTSLASPTP